MYLLGIIIVAALVYLIVKPGHQHGSDSAKSNDAEEILKKRFVSGEIDEETYKKMLRTLHS